jgi:hypothetical protein
MHRKWVSISLIVGVLVASAAMVYAGEIESGVWRQTSSTAADCPDCTVTVLHLTPHIIQLDASNGWIGFAHYEEEKDEYQGFLELRATSKRHPENWVRRVFSIKLTRDQMTMTLDAKSSDVGFVATYRKQ